VTVDAPACSAYTQTMSNQPQTIIPTPYCTTACGRIARDSDAIAYHRHGAAWTLACRHDYAVVTA